MIAATAALADLALPEPHARVALGDLQGIAGRGEEELTAGGADPERAADAAGQEEELGLTLVEPGGGQRPPELVEAACGAAVGLGQGEDHLGIDGHLRLGALEAITGHQRVVVVDVAVVDPEDGAVADGVVVRIDPRVALGVVADVDQGVAGVLGQCDLLEQGAGAAALLVDDDAAAARPVRVTDRVGTALGNAREQGLGGTRPVDRARSFRG